MKKLILVAVVIAALALTLAPLAGAKTRKHGHDKFNAVGRVVAVDVADTTADPAAVSTITISVKAGTKTVRTLRHTDALFSVAAEVKVRMLCDDGAVAKTLADVPTDTKVKVRGVIDRSDPAGPVFIVTWLKYHELAAPATPEPVTSAAR